MFEGFSLVTLTVVALGAAAPLLLAALGGMFSERSGIINIGLEGMMLSGAFAAGLWGYFFQSGGWVPWVGFLWAGLAGALLAWLHAWICIRMKADQIISGVALNILASQSTIFLSLLIFGGKGGSGLLKQTAGKLSVGTFQISPFFLVSIAILVASSWAMFRTPFGLRLRASGEHPQAAASAGISVSKMRTIGVLLSGLLAGFAGAILVNEAGNFSKDMTAGRGYIALAALIFGGWKPWPVLFACLLFGFAYALNFQVQSLPQIHIPSEFLDMLPYLLTILALAGVVGRSQAPAVLGQVEDH